MQNGAIIFIFSSMFMHLKLPFFAKKNPDNKWFQQTYNNRSIIVFSKNIIEMNQRKSEGGGG